MGAAISSSLSMGLTYCCCSASSRLCQACFGSTTGTTGRKRSVLLLLLAIILSLWMQYSLGPALVLQKGRLWYLESFLPGSGVLTHAWKDDCAPYAHDEGLLAQCAGNAGVYRMTAVTAIFFTLLAMATRFEPALNRDAWPAKYALYLLACFATLFVPTAPLFSGVFLTIARMGATVFVVLQQIILIDVAYNWNDDWVERSEMADRIDYGSGAGWLQAIVGTCIAFYAAAVVGIGCLYHYFAGCVGNEWIISLTLIGVVALTAIQVTGNEGSLLTSSVMSLYAVYLAYSMVSKNPDGTCNPQLGQNDIWGILVGLTLTAVSLAWTGWSWTAEDRLNVDKAQTAGVVNGQRAAAGEEEYSNLDAPFIDPNDQPTAGVVVDDSGDTSGGSEVSADIWKLNVVMVLISCFVAMTLTGWGTVVELDENLNAANPTIGHVNMAMLGVSQWLAIGLYIWTLVAPQIFLDRDFS